MSDRVLVGLGFIATVWLCLALFLFGKTPNEMRHQPAAPQIHASPVATLPTVAPEPTPMFAPIPAPTQNAMTFGIEFSMCVPYHYLSNKGCEPPCDDYVGCRSGTGIMPRSGR